MWGGFNKNTMPLIWVRHKNTGAKALITGFVDDDISVEDTGYSLNALFIEFTFLDGSTCGVEE